MSHRKNLTRAERRTSKNSPTRRRRLRVEALEARIVLAAPGDIVINEVMRNPAAVSDSDGEWFELVNTTSSSINIDGLIISDNDLDGHVINNGGSLVIPAHGYLVLGRNSDFGSNGGVNVDYEYAGIALANGADELVLVDSFATEIDRVEWDNGNTFPDPNGASMALADSASDNNVGTNWCQSTTAFGAGDFGTPGAENDCGTGSPGDVVINEIMQNPNAVFDSSGEWFELYNPTTNDIDINGWMIGDDDTDSQLINNSGPLVLTAGGYLVLGNNANDATNGGVTVDYEYPLPFFLANGSDELVLRDSLGTEIDSVKWDSGLTYPDPTGASMALADPSLDNSLGIHWCTSSTPFGAGDLGTPGEANDCAPVPDSGANQTVFRNELVGLEGTWTDPQAGSDNPYAWSWDLDGDGSPDSSGSASYGDTIPETTSFSAAGVYTLTFAVTDKSGATGTDSVDITVVNRPPDCTNMHPSIETIWPPNHKFVPVDVLGATDSDGDAVTITIDSIFQDEAVDGPGIGNTNPDGTGVGSSTANVRAERNGGGNGRVYHVGYTADDGHGGSCTGVVQVVVPHSKKQSAIDEGPLFDSTGVPAPSLIVGSSLSADVAVVDATSDNTEDGAGNEKPVAASIASAASKAVSRVAVTESLASQRDQLFTLLGDADAESQEALIDLLEEAGCWRAVCAEME